MIKSCQLFIIRTFLEESMAQKSKSKQHHNQSKAERNRALQSRNKAAKPIKKERGFWLTFAIVLIVLHSIAAAIYYISAKAGVTGTFPSFLSDPRTRQTVILTMMIVHMLANVVAALGIWFWKKWGLYVYAASAILALVAGLISVGIWSAFYMVLPVAILGWLVRTKWAYFD